MMQNDVKCKINTHFMVKEDVLRLQVSAQK